MFAIIMLIIQIVVFIISLFTNKPDIENAKPKTLGDFQVPTAVESRAIPILWGTADIRGPNVIWYGDLKIVKIVKKVSTGFSSKKITVGFRYFIGMDLLLCYGLIDRVTRLEARDKVASSAVIGPFGDTGVDYVVDAPTLFGGKEKGGGVAGTFRVYGGTPDQIEDPYMVTRGPGGGDATLIPGYVDIAHAVAEQVEIGESVNLGNYVFRCTRFPDNLGLTGDGHIIRGTVNDADANPAEVIFEILTSNVFGLSVDVANIDIPSFIVVGDTLKTEGNGISQVVDTIKPAEATIKDILRQINGVLFEDPEGKFFLKLIRDDFSFPSLPIFDESNVISLDTFSRPSWSETHNHVNLGYTDRTKDFIDTGAMAQDLGNFRTQGQEARVDFNYPGVAHPTLAREIAERELLAFSFPFPKVVLTVNREGATLRPGDVIRFSWGRLGLTDMLLRVMIVDFGNLLNNQVTLDCVQDVFRTAETIYSDPNPTDWVPINTDAVPYVTEQVRGAPRLFLNLSFFTLGERDPSLGERVQSVARRPSGVVVQLEQFVDVGDGQGFVGAAGRSVGNTPLGTIESDYPADTADVETSDLLVIGDPVTLFDNMDAITGPEGTWTAGADDVIEVDTVVFFEGGGAIKLSSSAAGQVVTEILLVGGFDFSNRKLRAWVRLDSQAHGDLTATDGFRMVFTNAGQTNATSWCRGTDDIPTANVFHQLEFDLENETPCGGGGIDLATVTSLRWFLLDPTAVARAFWLDLIEIIPVGTGETEDLEVLEDALGAAEIADGNNLGYIEGAAADGSLDEIIGWENLIDNGNDTFTLQNVHRGLMDTQARAHLAGARIWFFSDGQAISDDVYLPTQAITVKHQSETTADDLDPALAAALPLTFTDRLRRPHHPANATIDSARFPVAVGFTTDMDVAWGHRTNDEQRIEDADVVSPKSQDTEVEYDIEFRHMVTGGVLNSFVLTNSSPPPTDGTWLSYIYRQALMQTDTGQVGQFPFEVQLSSRYSAGAVNNPPNLASVQTLISRVSGDIGGAAAQSVDLDGSTEYLANTTNNTRGYVNKWTWEVWVKWNALGGGAESIKVFDPSASNANRIELSVAAATQGQPFTAILHDSGGTLFKDFDFGSIPAAGTWTQIAFTFDGDVTGDPLTVYQDGADVTSSATKNTDTTGTMTNGAGRVIVGVDDTLAAGFLDARVWGLGEWTRSLLTVEIIALYNGGSGSAVNRRFDFGNYAGAFDNQHFWDFRETTSIGADFGNEDPSETGSPIDILVNAVGITGADLVADTP